MTTSQLPQAKKAKRNVRPKSKTKALRHNKQQLKSGRERKESKASMLEGLPRFLRRDQAAEALGFSVKLLDQLRRSGQLPSYRVSRKVRLFAISDLEAFMAARRIDVGSIAKGGAR